jgi:flagellar hook protein FlgE
MSALQSGIMGMLAHQLRMDAVGNNIANANTVGYKALRAMFTDAFYQALEQATAPTANHGGTNPSSIGQGVLVAGVDTQFRQGDLMATGRTTDVAIEGDGFLCVTDGETIFYTRNGALALDADGNLVHVTTGLRVVALPPPGPSAATPGALGVSVSPASTIRIPVGQTGLARATSQVNLAGNLDSRGDVGATYGISARVYDSLGNGHDVTLTFTRTDTGWSVTGDSPDGAVTVGPPAEVTFDADGRASVEQLALSMTLSDPKGANPNLAIGVATGGMAQTAQESNAALRSQDGSAPGTLTGLSIGADGAILGVYSNGLTRVVGQLVTAGFANNGGLAMSRSGLYSASVNSGVPAYGSPGSGGRGPLRSGQLEASNVNLAQEFADMIVTQRGFQASSRVVTTADQMLQELMNVVR